MFSADYDSKQGSLMIRYKRRDRLLGVLLVVFGGFTLPVGLTLFLSLGWLSKLPWMVSGLGAITLAGGMLILLRSRFVPLGFEIDRGTVRIVEKGGASLVLPLSFFNECGIRSAEGRRRGPFFIFLRGPAGLDFDLSSDASEKNAARHLQLLCQATALPLPVDSASPEEALRKAFAVPTLDLSRRLDDAAKDLKPLVQRLKSDGRLTLSASGRTLRFRDPAARRHSTLSVLFLFFIVAMGMTAFLGGIPVFAAVFVFSILTLIGGWLMLATVRSWLYDDGLSAADGGLVKRRFALLQRQVADLRDRPAKEPAVPVLTFTTQTGVPAVGYFSESYRRQVENLTLQPLALMSLSYRRFFAYPHRLYGYTLSESIALYSAIREVFYYGRR